jgi:hypothetical protein
METLIRDGSEGAAQEGEALALTYGLLSPWTSLVVVRQGARAEEAPVLHKVQQMAPAGWAMFAGARHSSGAVLRSTRHYSAEPVGLAGVDINSLRQGPMIVHDRSLRSPVGRFSAQMWTSRTDPQHHDSDGPGAGGLGLSPSVRRTGRAAPADPILKRLATALEKALVFGGLPQTIDGLVQLGLSEERATSLRLLAAAYGEQAVVQAFVALLFEVFANKASMAARVAAQQIAALVDATLMREVVQIA